MRATTVDRDCTCEVTKCDPLDQDMASALATALETGYACI